MKPTHEFDRSRLEDWDEGRFERQLKEFPEIFENQLAIAQHLDMWGEGIDSTDDQREGVQWAMRQVAASLRLGQYLPGGLLLGKQ